LSNRQLQINFSYVLNEPSTSRVVTRAVRASRRYSRKKPQLLRWFSNLSDTELADAISSDPHVSDLSQLAGSVTVLTASVGLPELLPRVLQLCSQKNPVGVSSIDGPGDIDRSPRGQLFGEPAMINFALNRDPTDDVIVAGLIVRPGERGLMLKWSMAGTDGPEDLPLSQSARTDLETLIRDYSDQWTPSRALWGQPVEITRPAVLAYRPSLERR
jgi:hypothetical protein